MKIAGLGDSNTWGFPFGPTYSWLYILGEKLSCKVMNHGVNGESVADMRARVPEVIRDQPDVVIITGGTNDAFEGIPVEQVGNELTDLIDQLQAKTSSTIILGLPIPLDYQAEELFLNQYRDWMRNFAAERQLPVIDFYSALLDQQKGGILAQYNADGVHPNREGFERMAMEAYSLLRKWK